MGPRPPLITGAKMEQKLSSCQAFSVDLQDAKRRALLAVGQGDRLRPSRSHHRLEPFSQAPFLEKEREPKNLPFVQAKPR